MAPEILTHTASAITASDAIVRSLMFFLPFERVVRVNGCRIRSLRNKMDAKYDYYFSINIFFVDL
mgnify:CR=1 FL=1